MSLRDSFKVYLYPDPLTAPAFQQEPEGYEDITSGIVNVDVLTGTDIYEGPAQQVDTAQFTIVSRNPNLDPKINPNVTYNARIALLDVRNDTPASEAEFFRGYITGIDVQYQRNDNPIITITGTDIFGILQRTVVNETLRNQIITFMTANFRTEGISFQEFVSMEEFYNLFSSKYYNEEMMGEAFEGDGGQIADTTVPFKFFSLGLANNVSPENFAYEGLLGYSPARYVPELGETFLEVINKYATTNLNSLSANGDRGYNYISVLPYVKNDGYYWNFQSDPSLSTAPYDFSSDPADDASYESIIVNNGFDRIINQIEVSNDYKYLQSGEIKSERENISFVSQDSIDDYAVTKLNLPTIFAERGEGEVAGRAATLAQNTFQIVANPSYEIQRISFNNARSEDLQSGKTYSFYKLNESVRIKHKVSDTETINRWYEIAGVRHSISPDNWTMEFTLKPDRSELVFDFQGYKPTLEMNSLTGDSNFNFTGTIVDYPEEDILYTLWCLNAREEGYNADFYYASSLNGERYKDGYAIFGGLTQTWNFDDDGILAEYSPLYNRWGGYGSGYWTVYVYIVLKSGFTVVAQQTLTVGTPVVEADFTWEQNLINNFGQVQFTDTSVNNEVGEPDSYLWDFGDGTTSTLRNPLKLYNPTGPTDNEFDVSLTVFAYGEFGAKVYDTKTQTVTLTQPTMAPDFTWTANAQIVTFTNTSTNVGFEEPDAYFWEFGDGTTSTLKNPVHTFPVANENVPESFSVKLTTRNIWEQTASVTKTVTTTALNKSGTFPVRYIKFRIDPYTKAGTVPGGGELVAINPVMSNLKATTSGTGANLTYLKPLIGFNDDSIPKMRWFSTDGRAVQESQGWQYFLTRDPAEVPTTSYGDGPANQNNSTSVGQPYPTVRWELVVDLGTTTQLINDINLRFEDLFVLTGPFAGLQVEDFYPKISVDVANVVTDYTPNPSGTFGPATLNGNWVNIGYIKVDGGRMDPTKPAGQRTNATKPIFKMRPMPLNIPYFNYTFNDKIVSFTSVETADSYAWNFGDGTTSTDKDPVKTYAAYGTYTVTLAVTNGGIVTRTTTEPVIVQAPVI